MGKTSYMTATDQFCGAGGNSLGLRSQGVEVVLGLNHWERAIETHNANFPDTYHECTDISACDPRRYPSTDILVTSPECTNHTLAKGVKRASRYQPDLFGKIKIDPASERSRSTMYDVLRFSEVHDYNIVIVENVVDARKWTPYPAWLQGMELLGYSYKEVYFNSMFAHPTPQSRDRMYVVFWKSGNNAPDLSFTPRAYCARCEKDVSSVQTWKNGRFYGKYKTQYVYTCESCRTEVAPYYYCAANAIDWEIPAPRIGDRKRPLAEKTMLRIQKGLDRYGNRALTTDAMMTQTTRQTASLVVPPYIVELFGSSTTRPISEALSTMTTRETHGLVLPFIASYYGTDNVSSIVAAAPTVTTVEGQSLVTPPMIVGNYSPGWVKPVTEPTGAITTADHHSWLFPDPSMIAEEIGIEDCGFRMLKPHEIQRAMGFPDDYIVTGNGRDKVKQLGNAVTPPVLSMIIERCVASLA